MMGLDRRVIAPLIVAVLALAAVAVGLARGEERQLRLDKSSLQSYKDFLATIGAVEEKHANWARHYENCARIGGGWVGSWRGPTGFVLSFCATGLPIGPAMGQVVCRQFAGMEFLGIEPPYTIVCGAQGGEEPQNTLLRLIGSVNLPAPGLDPDDMKALVDPAQSFPARECKRREALHNTEGRKAVLFPKPWSFAGKVGEEGIESTCWNPDLVRESMKAHDPEGWRATWDRLIEKPGGWQPASEEMMEWLCQKTFGEHLAPIFADPITPEIAKRHYAWLMFGWWWCGN